ncbi:NADPH--cytochrome P450 reductase-like protein [Lophiostoma macrostomum CBS 122681]|uniref:Bifunctional cytochrome P450/NADPH--P450 reductase n=1 Tax=Lophiostoma macrostomum CBS 122681 TaxID=1314788 RepID=A0A6A6TQM2_9PLEO|nr:NADPH--cytochrome P450 reductase-like protein [Lophiostoma macrostomum CBS 122681]
MPKPIPSPPGLPFIGNLLDVATSDEPLSALERLAGEYGPIYKLNLKGQTRVIVSNYELFEELCDETKFFKAAGLGLQGLGKGGPPGLFTAPSEKHPDWGQAHRILMPAFGPLAIQNMFDEMHDIASQLVLKWARKGADYQIPVTEDFTRLTLDTIALCGMDFRFNSFYQDDMHPFVQVMTNTLSAGQARQKIPSIVQMFMRSANEQLKADAQYQKQVAGELVAHRRNNPSDKQDLLNAMIHGRDPKTGASMRDELIASNMITFLIAGHETTSGLLSFAFYNILKNPATYFKAQQEVDTVIGKGKVTTEQLKTLQYINAILRETLRLNPTAPAFTRSVREENQDFPGTLGNNEYEFKREWTALCLLGRIQRDPKVYGDDANEFIPERMLDENFDKLPKSAWKPFGSGMRACIGRAFAWQEALLVVALLLQNFDIRMDDPSYELKVKSTLTHKPQGFYMRAALRKGVSATTLQNTLSSSSGAAPATSSIEKSLQKLNVDDPNARPLTILHGSNTGTCKSLAQKLAVEARSRGFNASVSDMDSGVNSLPTNQPVVVITASYEGEPPDNAAQFVAWLESMTLANVQALSDVEYSVFGCGHKDWASTFHRIPKLVDDLFQQHGGQCIAPRGASDASQGDMFSDFDTWTEHTFWPAVTKRYPEVSKADLGDETSVDMEISTTTRASHLQHEVEQAKVLHSESLTATSEPDKRLLTLELPEGMEYEAGDYLTVLPLNPDESVHRVLSKFSIPWDAVVTIKEGGLVTLPTGRPISAFDLLKGYVELSLPATKKSIQTVARYTSEPQTHETLNRLSTTAYSSSVLEPRLSILDILTAQPSINLPFATYLSLLPPMRSRHYSISSSPFASPTTCSITYGVLATPSLADPSRPFHGVAGTYLRSLRPNDALQVSVRRAPPAFHLPASMEDTPMLMLCNGTGIAPFRGFVQQRAAMLAANPSLRLAPALLFIGCRAPGADALYADEFAQWAKEGAVELRYAYSREPQHADSQGCKYVQDRMWRDRADVVKLWVTGAKVFLCGSPGLVKGVKEVARKIVREEKREATEEQIEKFFMGMRNSRIAVDVFA